MYIATIKIYEEECIVPLYNEKDVDDLYTLMRLNNPYKIDLISLVKFSIKTLKEVKSLCEF